MRYSLGEAYGLVKILALMTHVTSDEEESLLISQCYSFGFKDMEEVHTPDSDYI